MGAAVPELASGLPDAGLMTDGTLTAGETRLVPLAAEHAEALRRIRSLPEVERWWDPVEDDFPLTDEPEATRYAVTLGHRIVGMVQYGEELEPKYRSASIDIFLDPAVHGRGVGSTAVRLVAEHLLHERGHHRLEIDPAAHNVAAIRAYAKAGFSPVGTVRLAERDAYDHDRWHDALLMERVVDPTEREGDR
jgi:RimJ/RimL family protein N-acetyltransferase